MKTILTFLFALTITLSGNAQSGEDVLRDLEQGQGMQNEQQQSFTTATLKSAARLFGAKDDLTTVVMIIPSGETVSILDSSDSTYYRVQYEDADGFILKRQAAIDNIPATQKNNAAPINNSQDTRNDIEGARPVQESQISRFTYLENKYGTDIAARINSGKIWKGMNGEMVRDSWGNPNKINRVISSNTVKEEWTYKSTMLYFQNNKLVEWGPVK